MNGRLCGRTTLRRWIYLSFSALLVVGQARADVIRPGRVAAIALPQLSVLGRAALLSDGRRVAVGGWDGRLLLYDLAADKALWVRQAHGTAIRALTVSDRWIVSGGARGAIHLWDHSGVRRATLRKGGAAIRDLAMHGQWVAAAVDGRGISLMSRKGKSQQLKAGPGRTRAVVFSPDGKLLASGGEDGKIRLHRVADGRVLATIQGHKQWINALAFAPDGKRLASAAFDKRTRIFSLPDGKLLHSLRGHVRRVVALAFDSAGKRLASASLDRTAVLWDAHNGRLLQRIGGHRYQLGSVAFGPRGRFLLTSSTDGYLRLFPLPRITPQVGKKLPAVTAGELILRANTSGERIRLRVLDKNGKVSNAALRRLSYILRSGPDDAHRRPDRKLIKFLYSVADHFGRNKEVIIISGFRSPRFNRLRRKQSRQVARKSKHMRGEAIDFRIDGVPITTLRRYVEKQRFGGVGYYPDSKFVHIDTGKVRRWSGN